MSGFESYFDALSTILMNVGQSAPRYEKYALLYPASTSLRQELCNYFSVVIDLCRSAVLFIRKPFVSQALHAPRKPFDDEFGKFGKDLVKFGEAVRDEISLAAKEQQNLDSIEAAGERNANWLFRRAGAKFQQDAAHQLEENKKWRELRLRSRFLNSCSTYNYETALNQARRKGRWLFQTSDYIEWKLSGSTSILLCSGIVGAGKTVLASSVVEELLITKGADVLISYFFCRDDDPGFLTAREIMGSLARQFLSGMLANAFNNVDRDVDGITLNTEQILAHLLRILPSNGQYIIVLDGLDECEPGEANHLFGLLQRVFRTPTHIFKLFWTGRSDFVARVVHRLQPNFHVIISQSKNGREISSFIELALDEALENGRLQLRDPEIIVKIQDALEAEACEMYVLLIPSPVLSSA